MPCPSCALAPKTYLLRSIALALTVVGTLVDLMPEALLITEIALNWRVLCTRRDAWFVFRLFLSDGKPVIRFAASDPSDHPRPPPFSSPVQDMQNSLRRRLASIAAGLHVRKSWHCCTEYLEEPKWTYAGLLGLLLGGELLTAVGAALFLHIKFSRAALASLLASIFALLASTRSNMRPIGEKRLHACLLRLDVIDHGRFFEFLIPGPLTLLRYLLLVPIWPMALVYAEGASSVWPFSMLGDGWIPSMSAAVDATWVWPLDWLRVSNPVTGRTYSRIAENMDGLAWVITLHLLWTAVAMAWTIVVGTFHLVRWYFGHDFNGGESRWGSHFANQNSSFHSVSRRLQGALGLGFTMAVVREGRCLFLFFVGSLVILLLAIRDGTCQEQEVVFAFAVSAWWWVMLFAHAARHRNFFQQVVEYPHPSNLRSTV